MTTVPVVRIRNALVTAMQEDIEDRSALEPADRLAHSTPSVRSRHCTMTPCC